MQFQLFIYSLCLVSGFTLSLSRKTINNKTFPDGFTFGTATSAYQIEGAWNESGKGENIWDHYTHQNPEKILDASNGDVACDSYHNFHEDVVLLKNMGVNFYRFSLSWSRILPTGFSYQVNSNGIRYYNELIDLLIKNNITPFITIFHYDTPQPLQNLGGFANELFVEWFEEYANVVFKHFGSKVKYWITFNEPRQICLQGYGSTEKPPAYNLTGIGEYICAHNLLKAHARVYHLYNNVYKPTHKGKISISLDTLWFNPKSQTLQDGKAAKRALAFAFRWFADPIFSKFGDYPEVMKSRIATRSKKEGFSHSRLPNFTTQEVEYIKGTYDFLGLNHYTTMLAKNVKDASIGTPSFIQDTKVELSQDPDWPGSQSSWLKVVPWGFSELLKWLKNTYGDIEIYITENGYSDKGELNDTNRINYYEQYLSAILDVIHESNVNVKGYTAWALMDNFEWRLGYTAKFGLHHVDFDDRNRTRTPKESAKYYQNVIRYRKLIFN